MGFFHFRCLYEASVFRLTLYEIPIDPLWNDGADSLIRVQAPPTGWNQCLIYPGLLALIYDGIATVYVDLINRNRFVAILRTFTWCAF